MPGQFWDYLLHGVNTGALVTALGVIIWAVKKLSRDESLKSDYPPHRHINGTIVYPKEYEPGVVGTIPSAR